MKFIRDNFHGFYSSKSIRKTPSTIKTILEVIQNFLDNNWNIDDKGIWTLVGNEEEWYSDLDSAFQDAGTNRRFAIFITLKNQDTSGKFFIRWYNSKPQTDILTLSGSLTIQGNKPEFNMTANELEKMKKEFEKQIASKISDEDFRELSQEYLGSQRISTLKILETK
jgi:hypothetical protein